MTGGLGKQRPHQRGETLESRKAELDCASGHQTDMCASPTAGKRLPAATTHPNTDPSYPGRQEEQVKCIPELCAKDEISLTLRGQLC